MPAIQDIRIHAPLVIAEGAILIPVCSVMVFLRLYARRISGSSLGLDDFAIAGALLFVIAMSITLIAETSWKGLGYASSEGDAGRGHPDANVAGWPGELLQVPALGCIKLSFLFLYRRVFTNRVTQPFRWANWFMIATITAWMIGYFFTLLFLCGTDFKAYWTSSATEKDDCLPTAPVHLGYAISDVITDVLTILLPIPEIWRLHLTTRSKLAITGVFGLGAITIAMSIIRMVIYEKALKGSPLPPYLFSIYLADTVKVQFDPDADFEYITTVTSYFSLLEVGLGLCAACLPVQYGLLRSKKVRSMFQSVYPLDTLGSHGSGGNNSSAENPHVRREAGARSYGKSDGVAGNENVSQSSETDASQATHESTEATHVLSHSELEMGNLQSA